MMLPDNLGQVAMEHLPPLDQCRGIQAPSAPHTSILRATLDRQLILFVLSAVVDARNVLFLAEDEDCPGSFCDKENKWIDRIKVEPWYRGHLEKI